MKKRCKICNKELLKNQIYTPSTGEQVESRENSGLSKKEKEEDLWQGINLNSRKELTSRELLVNYL